jgi:hypothetical protein
MPSTIAPEFGRTGSLSTRRFQWLFAGKIRHFGAPLTGRPDAGRATAVSAAPAASAAAIRTRRISRGYRH